MLSPQEIAIRLILAAILGGVIGFERERRHAWAAGLRTHMLVCLGAALVMIVSAYGFFDILNFDKGELQSRQIVLDPSRIAAQVVSGIGFLGAGTIMFLHRENIVRGLTTAAGLWTVAAIGLAVGGGMYAAALIATGIAWLILGLLRRLERYIVAHRLHAELHIHLNAGGSLAAVDALLKAHALSPSAITADQSSKKGSQLVVCFPPDYKRAQILKAIDAMRNSNDVASVQANLGPNPGN